MSKRVLLLSLLCLSLLIPAHAGANHEVPHVDPLALVRSVGETYEEQRVNRLPMPFIGFLHVDHATDRWWVDCTDPTLGPLGSRCLMVADGDIVGDGHIGPVDAPACSIPAGSGGTGRWDPFPPAYHPADLLDLEFAPAPSALVTPPVGAPAALVMHGSWRDDLGRADRFAAVLTLLPLSCDEMSHYRVFQGQGWALGLR